MSDFIPLSVPSIQGNEWKYIKECLDTEWVSSAGKYVNIFEEKICELTGSKYSIACINGTAALHTALRIVGCKTNEEVIVPTLTFIAPVNVVRYMNAHPIFMDCDDYYNLNIEKTIEFIEKETNFQNSTTLNKHTKRRICAIIPVHVFGNAANLGPLISICRDRNIKIIEDATESLGTYYVSKKLKGRYTGTIGDIGCYSFNGNKIITTGGGGMIVTDNLAYAEKARYLTTQAKDDEVRYIHNEIGYNFRLTNIQAALGVAQLEQLKEFIAIKKKNYNIYKREINKTPGLYLTDVPKYANNNYWMYPLQINKEIYGKDREQLMTYLSAKKIQARPVWQLNHLQTPYKKCFNYKVEKAHEIIEKTLNIPCSVNLSEEQILKVIDALK